ncbi:MAG: 50S ribosomal protein L3 [Verrucomicrobium sp.]
MSIGLIGKKVGMTQVYLKDGSAVAVTVIDVAGNQVVQVKNEEKDGYSAVQLGYADKKENRSIKPELAHFKKHNASLKYVLREFRTTGENPESGTILGADKFAEGEYVDVIGTTKGKGFSGVVKRYNFAGQPASHGSMMHRRTGSIGCRLTPGRVWKNQKMPGRHGFDRRTTQNLKVVQSRVEDGVLLIAGAVPGPNGSYVIVRPAIKKQSKK